MSAVVLFEVDELIGNGYGEAVGEVGRITVHASPEAMLRDVTERISENGVAEAYVFGEVEALAANAMVYRPDQIDLDDPAVPPVPGMGDPEPPRDPGK